MNSLPFVLLGPDDAYIRFNSLDISPMPFDMNSKVTVSIDMEVKQALSDSVSLDVNFKRSNLNSPFSWEVSDARSYISLSGMNVLFIKSMYSQSF